MTSKNVKKRLASRKKIADKLREGPQTVSKLIKETEILKGTVIRILREFKTLDLAEKNEKGEWCWKQYLPKFGSFNEFELALRHSKDLIPGLRALLIESIEFIRTLGNNEMKLQDLVLKKYAEQHLKTGYSEMYSKLLEYRKLDQETQISQKRLESFKKAKFLPPERFMLFDWETVEPKNFLNRIFPQRKMKRLDVPYAFLFDSYDGAKKAVEEAKVQARFYGVQGGKCYVLGPLYMEGDPEKIDRLLAVHGELAEGIDTVILKIEHGTPLVGKCEICPPTTILK